MGTMVLVNNVDFQKLMSLYITSIISSTIGICVSPSNVTTRHPAWFELPPFVCSCRPARFELRPQ